MQKRFCSCGHMVLVQYLCRNGVWKPRLISRDATRRDACQCPSCGNPLSIHTLR